MQMRNWGESAFVNYLTEKFPAKDQAVGIGDDCAQIPLDQNFVQLVTTDSLVEGLHFLKEEIPPRDLGYKTVAVNVSDIAAMGGIPEYAFLAIAIPPETDTEWLKQLLEGIHEGCTEYNVALLGGDTVGSKRDLFLNMTLIGRGRKDHIKTRHTAAVGDLICICGQIGSSGAGLKAVQQKLPRVSDVQELITAHFRPRAQTEAGPWLAAFKGVHAMMDLSDGLEMDLRRILKASNCGATVDVDKLPLSPTLQQVCKQAGWDVVNLGLTGGEDYALLLTVVSADYAEINAAFEKRFGRHLYVVGTITDHPEQLLYLKNGQILDLSPKTFDHFG